MNTAVAGAFYVISKGTGINNNISVSVAFLRDVHLYILRSILVEIHVLY